MLQISSGIIHCNVIFLSGATPRCKWKSWKENMRSVCFFALFLCVAGSPKAKRQRTEDLYVCNTWYNREVGKDYCCLKSCDTNQEEPSWCYVREPQNRAKYCSPADTETYKGIFDGYSFPSFHDKKC